MKSHCNVLEKSVKQVLLQTKHDSLGQKSEGICGNSHAKHEKIILGVSPFKPLFHIAKKLSVVAFTRSV
jgi:hypothetical protein